MRKKILIVDDDDVMTFLVKKLLNRKTSFNTVSCSNGMEALEVLRQTAIDAMLLNINMPIMNGFDLLNRLQFSSRNYPIVILSSSIDGSDIKRAYSLGASEYIIKPFSLDHASLLEKCIEEFRTSYVGITYINNRMRYVRLHRDGRFEFSDERNNGFLPFSVVANDERLKKAVEEFEELINNPRASENDLHHFFLNNSDFILNDDHKKAHSKLILQRENDSLVPDFVLEPFSTESLCDILELKHPDHKLFTIKKNRVRFSASVFEACAQLREYAAYFDDQHYRESFARKYGLNVYRPTMIVIIGKTKNVDPLQLRRAECDIPGFKIRTYDDILRRMKRKLK